MSDSLSREQFVELCGLIQALHDERITPEDSARLEEWVCRDEEARWIYVQYMNLYASLHWDKTQEPELDQAAPKTVVEASPSPILGFLGDVFRAGADFPRWLMAEHLGRRPRIRLDGYRDGVHMMRYDQSVFLG